MLLVALLVLGSGSACGAGDADGDADVDGQADGDVDTDAGDNADGDVEGDADTDADTDADSLPPLEDWSRDILETRLEVDVEALAGRALITLAPSASAGASLEVGTLTILNVALGADGESLQWDTVEGALHVGVPADVDPLILDIDYEYIISASFQGAMDTGVTLTWPYWCGNLFPCHPDPADGLQFELEITGVPAGEVAVYPEVIPADSPSYAIAWAIGEYEELVLGTTVGGVTLSVWYRPHEAAAAAAGTAHLLEIFEWYEATLGPYPFGLRAGPVAVSWGAGAFGGMEHHPLWHISGPAMSDEPTHAHEATHGWFGNGVRIACWEDFVLSEGTVSYLEARVLEEVVGVEASDALWSVYQTQLDRAMRSDVMKIAWPESCGVVDMLRDQLFSRIPYTKGAFFFRALEARVGVEPLLSALRVFFMDNRGEAASMSDLLDVITAQTGYDPTACAEAWLRTREPPDLPVCL